LAGGFIAAIVIGIIVFFLSVPLDLYLRFEADEKFRFLFAGGTGPFYGA
jgi:hypothetical protein